MGYDDGSGWNWLGVMFCRSGEFPDSITGHLTLKLHFEKQDIGNHLPDYYQQC
jgi:hypothetical protein